MTKQEVLQDIDKLCGDIDKWTTIRTTEGITSRMINKAENIIVSANQELSFLRDYIEENVKED